MGVIGRFLVFFAITVANAILFVFHSRVVLSIVETANSFGTGPASGAINMLPVAMQLGMAILEVGAVLYLVGGLGQERTATRGPV